MNSQAQIQIAFEGRALASHSMDVEQLAPALLALGQLFSEANRTLNRGTTTVNVRVRSDFAHGCFLANLEVAMSLLQQFRDLVGDDRAVSATELAQILGITTSVGALGLIQYLKKKGRKRVKKVSEKSEQGTIDITLEGDNATINVHNVHVSAHELSNDPRVLRAVGKVIEPTQEAGVDSVEFRRDGKAVAEITKDQGLEIINGISEELQDEVAPQVVEARLSPYQPSADPGAIKWRFTWGEKTISADISGTEIAKWARDRGGVSFGDMYRVELEISEKLTADGKYRNEYKILKVLNFRPGSIQVNGFLPSNGDLD